MRKHREDLARQYEKEEEEALARGEVEVEYVEEFKCFICNKTFKNEKVLNDHLNSKKHKDAEAKYRAKYQLDDEVESKMNEQE